MRDLVVNRSRVPLLRKLRLGRLVLRENGFGWCLLFAVYYWSSSLADFTSRRMDTLRLKHGLPGLNGLEVNKEIWDSWNWQAAGEEWTSSQKWKSAVSEGLMARFLPSGGTLLEIGPGGGRWTEWLLDRADAYIGIDVSPSAIHACRRRFAGFSSAQFLVGSGKGLEGVANGSIDGIWSFDVFVHINTSEVAQYLREFNRVLRDGAQAVIHHGAIRGTLGGWRSDLSQEAMLALIAENGLEVVSSFREWSYDGEPYRLDTYNDMVTVIRKPEEAAQNAGAASDSIV